MFILPNSTGARKKLVAAILGILAAAAAGGALWAGNIAGGWRRIAGEIFHSDARFSTAVTVVLAACLSLCVLFGYLSIREMNRMVAIRMADASDRIRSASDNAAKVLKAAQLVLNTVVDSARADEATQARPPAAAEEENTIPPADKA